MTDAELGALTALVELQRELCAKENEQRLKNGYSLAWTAHCLPSDEEEALRNELQRRGVLPQQTVSRTTHDAPGREEGR